MASIFFNGTEIPEDTANVLNFNGQNITEVVFNGSTVWLQNLWDGAWSGNAIAHNTLSGDRYFGIETDNARGWRFHYVVNGSPLHGQWRTVDDNGNFSGDSVYNNQIGIVVSGGNGLQMWDNINTTSGTVTYDIDTSSFSGTSVSGSTELTTSIGGIGAKIFGTQSSYITLIG